MITYKEAGVNIEAGYEVVKRIKRLARSTFGKEVIREIGLFGGFFAFDKKKYKEPILVSGTDGVGTKLKLAFMMNKHDTVGIDLVAMNVDDVVTSGAKPLFFLDYIACQKIDPEKIEQILKGVVEGCRQAGTALIGGETAELSDFYAKGEYDLAGFAVGVVEKNKIIDGRKIKVGDKIIGLSSSGLHSNGYTLARKVLFEVAGLNIGTRLPGLAKKLGEELLTPTKIYAGLILRLLRLFEIKGIAHITGGGLPENVSRILPKGTQAVIDSSFWKSPPIFKLIQESGNISRHEMFKTFNMGVGMALVVNEDDTGKVIRQLGKMGEKAFVIGEIKKGKQEVIIE